jgi:hypothetical protein
VFSGAILLAPLWAKTNIFEFSVVLITNSPFPKFSYLCKSWIAFLCNSNIQLFVQSRFRNSTKVDILFSKIKNFISLNWSTQSYFKINNSN